MPFKQTALILYGPDAAKQWRIPFDNLWRKDLTNAYIIRSTGPINWPFGPFRYFEEAEPVMHYLQARHGDSSFSITRYPATFGEIEFGFQWFELLCDFVWLRQAAQQNNAICQRLLGFLCANAWGPEHSYDTRASNDQEARHWLNLASKQGDQRAKTLLSALVALRPEGAHHEVYDNISYTGSHSEPNLPSGESPLSRVQDLVESGFDRLIKSR